jgi:DNA modification methylase
MQNLTDPYQLDLFQVVSTAFSSTDTLSTADIYSHVQKFTGLPDEAFTSKEPIGVTGQEYNKLSRTIRWHQQTLKNLGLIERVEGTRGLWTITGKGKIQLRAATPGTKMLAFSTDLGMAIWGNAEDVYNSLDVPISLIITSPPYPLRVQRSYGGPTNDGGQSEQLYIDWLCTVLEPVIAKLKDGGSLTLNISNDIFTPGMPSRSLYKYRLVLALCDRFGLHLVDEIPWVVPNKLPGPIRWTSMQRQLLCVGWEPILHFTNNPLALRSSNQRVLQPHSERHLSLMANGGEARAREACDGELKVRKGSFSRQTAGAIPKNVITRGHTCSDQRAYKSAARALGLPVHSAPFPLELIRWLIRYLTEEGELVVDLMGGTTTTGKASQLEGRRWIVSERIWEYLRGGAERYREFPEFRMNSEFAGL